MRSEEGERAVAISSLRWRLGVMTVRCQASSLLGRLETLGPGGAAAVGRRQQAGDIIVNLNSRKYMCVNCERGSLGSPERALPLC